MSRLVLLSLLLWGGAALAQEEQASPPSAQEGAAEQPPALDEAAERAAVREKLTTQRAALALIESRKVSALEVLEMVEQRAVTSSQRVKALERDLTVFRKRLAVAEQEDAVTQEMLRGQMRRLSPRLWGMYRLMRRRPLEVLLSARDFSAMVWRSRALRATLEEDLRLLRTVQRVARLRRQSAAELRRLKGSLDVRLGFLREQEALSRAQQAALEEVVGAIKGEAELARRMVRELEQADADLTRVIQDLNEGPAASGFGSLKGKLPFPSPGVIEVGFGKVVNPRFNTVTVQKGVDIRASAGTPVKAVAEGTVAYAGWMRGYGNLLILDHGGGYHTLVAHLASVSQEVGAQVAAGDVVGEVGDTGSLKGAYLYFEIRRAGQAVDPAPWLAR
ncbi:murein hydrolase activator EnvC family protein [Archangium lansingense]|uniref:Peptidoglycan DD-metalloendopeptidase family protein n=1 Tax=Archangium lansingense TaxID=2995310 RepID=A0ABT4AHP3_9BACT|nr:peptidoglycan DD-metalloendopeptidase family protein [Archangium lansinium]MCY1081101.1 peptidoglycan DD-metalloendopeptidase family protein [Archangium lansinium]